MAGAYELPKAAHMLLVWIYIVACISFGAIKLFKHCFRHSIAHTVFQSVVSNRIFEYLEMVVTCINALRVKF